MLYQLSYLAAPTPELSLPIETKNRPASAAGSGYSGGGIRTRDLRVMSPTSYQAAPPRDKDTECNPLGPVRQPLIAGESALPSLAAGVLRREATKISGTAISSSP